MIKDEADLQAAVPRDTLTAKARRELVKNLRQLLGWSGVGNHTGNKDDRDDRKIAGNWQHLGDLRWIQHDDTGEVVPLVGKLGHMFSSVVLPHPNMTFNERKLKNLLNKSIQQADGWRLCAEPEQVWRLGSGSSLVGLGAATPGMGVTVRTASTHAFAQAPSTHAFCEAPLTSAQVDELGEDETAADPEPRYTLWRPAEASQSASLEGGFDDFETAQALSLSMTDPTAAASHSAAAAAACTAAAATTVSQPVVTATTDEVCGECSDGDEPDLPAARRRPPTTSPVWTRSGRSCSTHAPTRASAAAAASWSR